MTDAITSLRRPTPMTVARVHPMAAWIAGVASVCIHLLVVIWLASGSLRLKTILAHVDDDAQWLDPVRVLDVLREMAMPSERWDSPRRETGGPAVSWQDESRGLVRLPDEGAMESPPKAKDVTDGGAVKVQAPETIPARQGWEPRQEILMIEKKVVRDEVSALPRRLIPRVERVRDAPDVTLPIDRSLTTRGADAGGAGIGVAPGRADIHNRAAGRAGVGGWGAPEGSGVSAVAERPDEPMARMLDARPVEAGPMKAIEKLLKARVQTYSSLWESRYAYFKIDIERAGDQVLPVIPKDILLIQDCSASMSEQRLFFCRVGLSNCLARIGANDRFNVVSFRDRAEWCFPDWKANKPEAVEAARRFVGRMESFGNTDVFQAAKDMLAATRTPGRPMVALMITDGRSTTGHTASSDIIGRFSQINAGGVSVYMMGTVQSANRYLLDLMSHGNRGESRVVTRGRWEIPESMVQVMDGVARPILADIRFIFADRDQFEVFPDPTTNLYLDRPLTLYGRYWKGTPRVVCQAVGRAIDVRCDMVFDLGLGKETATGDKAIRQRWAEQKIYHLIGQYTRTRKAATLEQLRQTAKDYGVPVPYEETL